jgi:hypothetical protein
MSDTELPSHIKYLIKEMSNEATRPDIRANYMLQLKDISSIISQEVRKFEKVYYE